MLKRKNVPVSFIQDFYPRTKVYMPATTSQQLIHCSNASLLKNPENNQTEPMPTHGLRPLRPVGDIFGNYIVTTSEKLVPCSNKNLLQGKRMNPVTGSIFLRKEEPVPVPSSMSKEYRKLLNLNALPEGYALNKGPKKIELAFLERLKNDNSKMIVLELMKNSVGGQLYKPLRLGFDANSASKAKEVYNDAIREITKYFERGITGGPVIDAILDNFTGDLRKIYKNVADWDQTVDPTDVEKSIKQLQEVSYQRKGDVAHDRADPSDVATPEEATTMFNLLISMAKKLGVETKEEENDASDIAAGITQLSNPNIGNATLNASAAQDIDKDAVQQSDKVLQKADLLTTAVSSAEQSQQLQGPSDQPQLQGPSDQPQQPQQLPDELDPDNPDNHKVMSFNGMEAKLYTEITNLARTNVDGIIPEDEKEELKSKLTDRIINSPDFAKKIKTTANDNLYGRQRTEFLSLFDEITDGLGKPRIPNYVLTDDYNERLSAYQAMFSGKSAAAIMDEEKYALEENDEPEEEYKKVEQYEVPELRDIVYRFAQAVQNKGAGVPKDIAEFADDLEKLHAKYISEMEEAKKETETNELLLTKKNPELNSYAKLSFKDFYDDMIAKFRPRDMTEELYKFPTFVLEHLAKQVVPSVGNKWEKQRYKIYENVNEVLKTIKEHENTLAKAKETKKVVDGMVTSLHQKIEDAATGLRNQIISDNDIINKKNIEMENAKSAKAFFKKEQKQTLKKLSSDEEQRKTAEKEKYITQNKEADIKKEQEHLNIVDDIIKSIPNTITAKTISDINTKYLELKGETKGPQKLALERLIQDTTGLISKDDIKNRLMDKMRKTNNETQAKTEVTDELLTYSNQLRSDINNSIGKTMTTKIFGSNTKATTFSGISAYVIKMEQFFKTLGIKKKHFEGRGRKKKSQLLLDDIEYKKGTKKLMKREKDIQKTKNFATEIGNAVSTSVKRGTTRLSPADLNAIINQILSS